MDINLKKVTKDKLIEMLTEERAEKKRRISELESAQRETEKKTRRSIDDFHAVRKVKQRRTMKEWERRQNGR